MFKNIAIDIGTTNVRIAVEGTGRIEVEPAVVAINNVNGKILAVGKEAKEMLGRNPIGISVVQPLKDGVVSDFNATEAVIHYILEKSRDHFNIVNHFFGCSVIIAVPSLITEVEINALVDSAKSAGARIVSVVEEPVAAAIGAGINIEDSKGRMIVDIGGGTTDIVIISMGGVLVDTTVKIAGDSMDESIIDYIKNKYNLHIGKKTAESVKISIASAIPPKEEILVEVKGQDIISGLPKTLKISNVEIHEAIQKILNKIAKSIKEAIEKAPTEIFPDLIDTGIILTGGGALIKDFPTYLSHMLNIKVAKTDDPLNGVIYGLKNLTISTDLLEKIKIKDFILK